MLVAVDFILVLILFLLLNLFLIFNIELFWLMFEFEIIAFVFIPLLIPVVDNEPLGPVEYELLS